MADNKILSGNNNDICFQYFALSEVSCDMGHGDPGRLHVGIPF